MRVNRKQWVDDQYTELWTDKTVSRIPGRLIEGVFIKSSCKDLHQGDIDNTDTPPMILVQYRGDESLIFAKKVRIIFEAPIVFNTRKLKTCLQFLDT